MTTPEAPKALIYWRKPSEWADLIYRHIEETGQVGSILTVHELFHGDEVQSCEFFGVPEELGRRIVRCWERAGRAQLFEATDDGSGRETWLELGIKFS